jgi:hypothetical protein
MSTSSEGGGPVVDGGITGDVESSWDGAAGSSAAGGGALCPKVQAKIAKIRIVPARKSFRFIIS